MLLTLIRRLKLIWRCAVMCRRLMISLCYCMLDRYIPNHGPIPSLPNRIRFYSTGAISFFFRSRCCSCTDQGSDGFLSVDDIMQFFRAYDAVIARHRIEHAIWLLDDSRCVLALVCLYVRVSCSCIMLFWRTVSPSIAPSNVHPPVGQASNPFSQLYTLSFTSTDVFFCILPSTLQRTFKLPCQQVLSP